MSKIKIIVEGITDVVFLSQYISFLFKIPFNAVKGSRDKDAKIESQDEKIQIVSFNGYTNLEKQATTIQEWYDSEYKIIIVFDADTNTHDDGGCTRRRAYLYDKLSKILPNEDHKDIPIFLFPNNSEDGNIETLLLKIYNEKFTDFNSCYQNYCKCISNLPFGDEMTDEKIIIYSYFQVYFGFKKAQEANRDRYEDLFSFENEYITSLANFLNTYLN